MGEQAHDRLCASMQERPSVATAEVVRDHALETGAVDSEAPGGSEVLDRAAVETEEDARDALAGKLLDLSAQRR